MPLPVIANVIRASVEGHTSSGHKWANVIHFRKDSALSFAAAIAILDPILDSRYATNVTSGNAPVQSMKSTAGMDQIRYTPLDGSSATSVITHVHAGAQVDDALPASTCLVVTVRTAIRGRRARGRIYIGPWTEGANAAGGTPASTTVSGLAVQFESLRTSLTGSGVTLGVASYLAGQFNDAVACTVDPRWDTQRRRLNV
jgi:hypothetical protein